MEGNLNCSLEKKNTVSFELNVMSCIPPLIFRLVVAAFFNNEIAVNSVAATESV